MLGPAMEGLGHIPCLLMFQRQNQFPGTVWLLNSEMLDVHLEKTRGKTRINMLPYFPKPLFEILIRLPFSNCKFPDLPLKAFNNLWSKIKRFSHDGNVKVLAIT